MPTVTNYK